MPDEKMELKDILSSEQFDAIKSAFIKRFGLALETCGLDGKERWSRCSNPCFPDYCSIIRYSQSGMARCRRDHLSWLRSVCKTAKPYIGICHAGLALACVPVRYKDAAVGGMFFGKCMTYRPDKTFAAQFRQRFHRFRFDDNKMTRLVRRMPVINEKQLAKAGDFLLAKLKQLLTPAKVEPYRKKTLAWQTQRTLKLKRLHTAIPKVDENSILHRAMEFIDSNFDIVPSLAEIAAFVQLSESRLSHLFQEKLKMTVVDYITRVRINNAKRMLETTSWSCYKIGRTVGYHHDSYFVRMFKRAAGITPQQWRVRHQDKKK